MSSRSEASGVSDASNVAVKHLASLELREAAAHEEAARMAEALQIAEQQMRAWQEANEGHASGAAAGADPDAVTPLEGFSPIGATGRTLERGKLALGLQANGEPADELRTEPASFIAHVLCDFEATGEGELSVSRGDFVTVLVGAEVDVPDGWCHCQAVTEGEKRRGSGARLWLRARP
jgi:hypothetical protein